MADSYPRGWLKFFPAKENGLTGTFPHQNYNAPGDPGRPWRDGDLCLDSTVHLFSRQRFDIEPREPHQRLRWHAERALAWLTAAAEGNLLQAGDPFELPQFPNTRLDPFIAFTEGPPSYEAWQSIQERSGLVHLARLRTDPTGYVVRSFCSPGHNQLVTPRWGAVISNRFGHEEWGVWVRLDEVPTLVPWRAPATWRELRQVCKAQGHDLDSLLRPVLNRIRDGQLHLALVGFPVPARIGDEPVQLHWQALELPVVSFGTETVSGFRAKHEKGHWQRDRRLLLSGDKSIQWIDSQNWHVDQLATRGALPADLRSQRVAIIGAGAIGSTLATLLVRGGVHDVTIVDHDRLAAGNLVRHTLHFTQVGEHKAVALAQQLNLTSPHTWVTAITCRFPELSETDRRRLQQCDIIIDCTADDNVLHALETFSWEGEKLFCSLSLGLEARRLFCFLAHGTTFPRIAYEEHMEPWFEKGTEELREDQIPWEGIGCWHPVFPAQLDAIWMLVAGAVQVLGEVPGWITGLCRQEMIVLERRSQNGIFTGVDRVPNIGVA